MRPNRLPALLVAVLAVGVLLLLLARHGRHAHTTAAVRASPTLTPGALNPEVTAATIRTTICVRGWTRTIRPPSEYTDRLKLEQMRAYGLTGSPRDYEEDHLVSLALGGAPTDPRNLWPEPRPRADVVDGVEIDLHRQVCDGSLSLADAQRRIADVKHRDG